MWTIEIPKAMYAIVLLQQFIFFNFIFFSPKKPTNTLIYNTRNSENYCIPKCRFQLYKSSFIPTVANEWNILSVDTRQSESIRIF